MIIIWKSCPEIEQIGDYAFGMGLWTPSAGAMPAKYAVNKLEAKSASLILSTVRKAS